MCELLPRIDESKTKANARRVLKQCRRLQRIAGRTFEQLKSPIITDMPRSDGYGNSNEEKIIKYLDLKLDAENKLCEIAKAVASLGCEERLVLYYAYFDREEHYNWWIADLLNVSLRTLEDLKSDSLIKFADAYQNGRLLEFQDI